MNDVTASLPAGNRSNRFSGRLSSLPTGNEALAARNLRMGSRFVAVCAVSALLARAAHAARARFGPAPDA